MFARRAGWVILGMSCCVSMSNLCAQDLSIPGLLAQTAPRSRPVTVFHNDATAAHFGNSYLGVGLVEVTDERAKALKLRELHGVEVRHVDEGSPAAKAGLKENDVVLEYNGQRVEGVAQFIRLISETPAGRKVNLTVWRSGSSQTLSATLEPRKNAVAAFGPLTAIPPVPPMPPDMGDLEKQFGDLNSSLSVLRIANSRIGIEGESLTPQLAEFFGAKQGVLIRSVTPNTPAEKGGLKAGDVVTKVGGTPVMSPREITGAVRTAKGKFPFTVVRNKKELTLEIELPDTRSAGNRDLLE